jgi:hypothetical protein
MKSSLDFHYWLVPANGIENGAIELDFKLRYKLIFFKLVLTKSLLNACFCDLSFGANIH